MTFVKESNLRCTCLHDVTTESVTDTLKKDFEYRVEYVEIPGKPGGQVHVYSPITGKQIRSFNVINDAHLRSFFRIDEVIFSGWTKAKDESRDEEKKDEKKKKDGSFDIRRSQSAEGLPMRSVGVSVEEAEEIYASVTDLLKRYDINDFNLLVETEKGAIDMGKIRPGSKLAFLSKQLDTIQKIMSILS